MKIKGLEEIEMILESLECKIKNHLRQTEINERDDLEQEIKIKIMEKVPVLMEEEVPSFFEFALATIN